MWEFACLSLEISMQLFLFQFSFSNYCCSVYTCFDCVVCGHYNQYLFALFIYSLSHRINESKLSWILASPLPPYFLDIRSLSTSYLVCKALCIFIYFLSLGYIFGRSSFVLFKNGPEYFTRRTVQVFIRLPRFLQNSLFSNWFLVHPRYSFFLSSPLLWLSPLQIFPNTCKFFFSLRVLIFSELFFLFLLSFVVSRFSLWYIFLCKDSDFKFSLSVLGFPILLFIFGKEIFVVYVH